MSLLSTIKASKMSEAVFDTQADIRGGRILSEHESLDDKTTLSVRQTFIFIYRSTFLTMKPFIINFSICAFLIFEIVDPHYF